VQEVLQADWQEARQFPQPPDLTDSRRLLPAIVLILGVFSVVFIVSPNNFYVVF
jgi:hypothetical protein